ncbi:MAG: hypothetical protein ACKOYM_02990, partial [Actinomycetes bacterium]
MQWRTIRQLTPVAVVATIVAAACTPSPAPPTTTTVPPDAYELTVLTGTSNRTVIPVGGVAVVDRIQSVTGGTSGLVVTAEPATDATTGIEVRVEAATASVGVRTVLIAAVTCDDAHDPEVPCPTSSVGSLVVPLAITVDQPTSDQPSDWAEPASSAWVTQADGSKILPGHVDVYLSAPNSAPNGLTPLLDQIGGSIVGANLTIGVLRVRVPNVAGVPNGAAAPPAVDPDRTALRGAHPVLSFVGARDYEPNTEAVEWLV